MYFQFIYDYPSVYLLNRDVYLKNFVIILPKLNKILFYLFGEHLNTLILKILIFFKV